MLGRRCAAFQTCRSRFSWRGFTGAPWGGNVPEPGGAYTVRSIRQGLQTGVTLLLLAELDNSHMPVKGLEPGFDSRYFRPLIERKTDISVFQAMLNPSKTEVTA